MKNIKKILSILILSVLINQSGFLLVNVNAADTKQEKKIKLEELQKEIEVLQNELKAEAEEEKKKIEDKKCKNIVDCWNERKNKPKKAKVMKERCDTFIDCWKEGLFSKKMEKERCKTFACVLRKVGLVEKKVD